MDLLMFVMAAVAGFLWLGPLRRQVAAYTMIVIAGLLKIYPLVLMALTLRERPRVFLWVNGVAAALVLTTGIYLHSEIVKMGATLKIELNAEGGGDSFGAYLLPDAVARKVDVAIHPGLAVLSLVKLATFGALFFLSMAGWFLCMVRWRDLQIALTRLPDAERTFLLIGAALISGCFFAGSNFGYRGIHLLFTLPGLLAMARMQGDMRVRRVAVQGCMLVLTLTWVGFFTWNGLFRQILASWIGQFSSGNAAVFVARESDRLVAGCRAFYCDLDRLLFRLVRRCWSGAACCVGARSHKPRVHRETLLARLSSALTIGTVR